MRLAERTDKRVEVAHVCRKALRLPACCADGTGGAFGPFLAAGTVPQLPGHAQATRMTGRDLLHLPPPQPAIAALNDGLRAQFDPRGIFARGA